MSRALAPVFHLLEHPSAVASPSAVSAVLGSTLRRRLRGGFKVPSIERGTMPPAPAFAGARSHRVTRGRGGPPQNRDEGAPGAADAPAPVPFYGLANPMPDAAGDAGVGTESGDGPEPTDGSGDALG